jgi:hypothetical protein
LVCNSVFDQEVSPVAHLLNHKSSVCLPSHGMVF